MVIREQTLLNQFLRRAPRQVQNDAGHGGEDLSIQQSECLVSDHHSSVHLTIDFTHLPFVLFSIIIFAKLSYEEKAKLLNGRPKTPVFRLSITRNQNISGYLYITNWLHIRRNSNLTIRRPQADLAMTAVLFPKSQTFYLSLSLTGSLPISTVCSGQQTLDAILFRMRSAVAYTYKS